MVGNELLYSIKPSFVSQPEVMDVALTALPKRMTLEDLGVLPLRVSLCAFVSLGSGLVVLRQLNR